MSDVVSLFEKRLKEALEGPEPPTAPVLKIALQYILATKLSHLGEKAGVGFQEDDDK